MVAICHQYRGTGSEQASRMTGGGGIFFDEKKIELIWLSVYIVW